MAGRRAPQGDRRVAGSKPWFPAIRRTNGLREADARYRVSGRHSAEKWAPRGRVALPIIRTGFAAVHGGDPCIEILAHPLDDRRVFFGDVLGFAEIIG